MASSIDPTNPTATSATTESVRANFQFAKDEIEEVQSSIPISVKDAAYGAIGDGATDDTIAIQAALDAATTEVKFGSNTYFITSELTIPPGIIVNLESCTIIAQHSTGNILKTYHDATGKPVFKIKGNRATISGKSAIDTNPNLIGLYIDTCNFSEFKGMVFVNLQGNSIVLGPTGARDIISINISDIETNTGEGIKLLSGLVSGVDYQHITDGTIKDSFFTITNDGGKAFEVISNDRVDTTAGSVFGLTIDRCSMNPVHTSGGTFISMIASGISNVYQMQFRNCEGELRYTGTTPTYAAIYLEQVNRSLIDFSGQLSEGDGIQLVNSQNNTIENARDSIVDPANTGRFIVCDATSFGNTFNNLSFIPSQMTTELDYTTAPLANYYFTNRIQDSGYMNKSTGIISSGVNRVFNTDYLRLINSSGDMINPNLTGSEASSGWVANAGGTYSVTCGTQVGFRFLIPDEVPLGSDVVIRCKYRITSTLVGTTGWRLASSVGGTLRTPTMDITASWNDMMYHTNIDSRRCDIYSTSSQTNVVFEIEKLEVLLGGFPYPANYNPVDLYRNDYDESPYGATGDRPVSMAIGQPYFDTTLGYKITFDGTNWVDYAGTTV